MSKLVIDLSQPAPVPQSLEEAQQLIAALWQLLVELQKRQTELEEQLNTHSENSSKPPSQDSLKQRAERPSKKPTGRAKGAQPGHDKHERALLDASEVDRIEHYYPSSACACGGEVVMDGYRRHQVFDLPEVRYQVVEHRCYSGSCSRCKARHRAALPDDVPSGQMGPGLNRLDQSAEQPIPLEPASNREPVGGAVAAGFQLGRDQRSPSAGDRLAVARLPTDWRPGA